MSDKLTFGDLKSGDKFIAFPLPGDDEGHGGYKGGHVLFYKWPTTTDDAKFPEHIVFVAKNFSNGTFSRIPDSMEVIKIV